MSNPMHWGNYPYGWYGVIRGGLSEADRFNKFSKDDHEQIASVIADIVIVEMLKPCDADYMPGPGKPTVQCTLHRGHPGDHCHDGGGEVTE